jgi:hypothetical protein
MVLEKPPHYGSTVAMRVRSASTGFLMIILAGCAAAKPVARSTTKFEGKTFTLELPVGWVRDPQEPAASGESHLFRSADGSFISVIVDPGAGDGRGDAWWKTEARGDRMAILKEEPACRPEDDPPHIAYGCPAGDGSLVISAGDVVLHGHYFHFWSGNTKRETGVDLQPFREILLSLRAK